MEPTTKDRATTTSDFEPDARTAADGGHTADGPHVGTVGGVSIEPATGLLHVNTEAVEP